MHAFSCWRVTELEHSSTPNVWSAGPVSSMLSDSPFKLVTMVEEFTDYAGRAEPKERWLKALPLIIAAVAGVPFLVLAIMFSLSIAQVTAYVFDLGTSGWEAAGFVLLSLSGAFSVIVYLVCLFIGTRRRTWKWRIWWAVGALLAAAILPIWWMLAGFV